MFHFSAAKVRRKNVMPNSTDGLFYIPQIWYFAGFAPYTLFIISPKMAKKMQKSWQIHGKILLLSQKD
jgi:hypothetical protein